MKHRRRHGGVSQLRAINDANIVRCPLAQDEFFLEVATHPRLVALANELLGDYVIVQQQNGVINPANDDNYQAGWHRDLPHQHFVCSKPLAVSALVCLDPFTEETGGTYVLPASHLNEIFPSEEYVQAHAGRGILPSRATRSCSIRCSTTGRARTGPAGPAAASTMCMLCRS